MENKNILTKKDASILLFCVFAVGFCTIIYELLIGSVSSYFIGDSITQFSITIGLTMTAMGIGTLLSRFISKNLIYWFILIEILIAIIGGLSVPILYYVYSIQFCYYPIMCLLIIAIGTLIGLEIPLLTRIMEEYFKLKENISNVLSLDYLGAFLASLAFPFLLLPFLGIFNSSLFAGVINLIIGILAFVWFKDKLTLKRKKMLKIQSIFIFALLIVFSIFSKEISFYLENSMYQDKVIFSKQTKYQKLVLTKNKEDVRLFIDGNVQFSTIDEYRYHEPLIHIPMNLVKHKENVLVLGGGDGLPIRELLKYKEVKKITVVDLDKEMTDLATKNTIMSKLNNKSFSNEKVKILNEDAFKFLENTNEFFDVIIVDLPDPNNSSLARLYSKEFYKIAGKKLAKEGIMVTQATSPYFSPEAYWCINNSLKAAGFNHTKPYHAYVPSFGDWGFILASDKKIDEKNIKLSIETKFLDEKTIQNLFVIPKDIQKENIKISTLNNPEILNYYLRGWKYWD
ncbi:MAG: polyamine aminopropyltransferase [Candidatus Gastranaerophilales bacterium]|nr:polyamine aminopropyltransferase [Candidatus Gastranaerophilales bacterium]